MHHDVMTVQDTISETVRLLMALRRERQSDVADALGLPRVSLGNRLAGHTRWTSDDLEGLAAHFAVPVTVLVTPPSDLVSAQLLVSPSGTVTGAYHLPFQQVVEPLGDVVQRARFLDPAGPALVDAA